MKTTSRREVEFQEALEKYMYGYRKAIIAHSKQYRRGTSGSRFSSSILKRRGRVRSGLFPAWCARMLSARPLSSNCS